jgi:cytochrome P450
MGELRTEDRAARLPEELDLFAAEVTDPYLLYPRLRNDPVQWNSRLQAWFLTDYADVVAVLRDPRLACAVPALPDPLPARLAGLEDELRALYEVRCLVMLHRQGPAHRRLRQLLFDTLTTTALASLRPRVEYFADSLLDRVEPLGRMELMGDFATPLSTATIAVLLGVPLQDMERFAGWCAQVFYAWPDTADLPDARTALRSAYECLCELSAYVTSLVAARRNQPGDDLVSALTAAADAGQLSEAELVANFGFVSESGRNTTAYAIGNAILALLLNRDQLKRLQQNPALVHAAVDECLRFDPPAVTVGRVALADLELAGKAIRQADHVMPLVCAANRDPAHLPADPDRLDVNRTRPSHLAFGAGPHSCPGAALARLETTIAIEALLRRLPGIKLTGPIHWQAHPSFRRLMSLTVSWNGGQGPCQKP